MRTSQYDNGRMKRLNEPAHNITKCKLHHLPLALYAYPTLTFEHTYQ